MIGQTVSHYRILQKLGTGGMGEVYLAEDTRLHRKVTLKFLPESQHKHPEARQLLLREARASSALSHPNIVTVHAVEETEDRVFIVMEYVEGEPIDAFVDRGGRSCQQIAELAQQIAEALSRAHAAGIIHRDIKPSNVLVDPTGRVRLLDFGIARFLSVEHQTRPGRTSGSLAYMSPEAIAGSATNEQSDLFSVGVLLYELIAGKRPFSGDYEASLVYAIVNEPYPPLSEVRPDVPAGLQSIVDRCLRKTPADRYATALDLATDLKRSGLDSGEARADTRRAGRRRGPLAVTGAALLVALAASLYVYLDSGEIETNAPSHRIMLAVLPFRNLGGPEDDELAAGLTDEITSRLGSLTGVGVISRTSVSSYEGTQKTVKQIGEELGVDALLEGSVQWDRTSGTPRVRIHPQLIRTRDDTHLWADHIDAVVTDLFEAQSRIAGQVSSALQVVLVPSDLPASGAQTTVHPEAYDSYLRGIGYYQRMDVQGRYESPVDSAVQFLERSVRLDSTFAPAWARLALTRMEGAGTDMIHQMKDQDLVTIKVRSWKRLQEQYADTAEIRRAYSRMYGRSVQIRLELEDWLAPGVRAARRSLELQPNLPEGHLAMARYYMEYQGDLDSAMREAIAADTGPGNQAEAKRMLADLHWRKQGASIAIDYARQAALLDPRSATTVLFAGRLFRLARSYSEAEAYLKRVLELEPDWPGGYVELAQLYRCSEAGPDSALAVLRQAFARSDRLKTGREALDYEWVSCLYQKEAYAEILNLLHKRTRIEGSPEHYSGTSYEFLGAFVMELPLQWLIAVSAHPPLESRAWVDSLRTSALAHADVPDAARENEYEYYNLIYLYSALGESGKATKLIRKAIDQGDLNPSNTGDLAVLAQFETVLGLQDSALTRLETLLRRPGSVSSHSLRRSPTWWRLRGLPRFEALLATPDGLP